MKLNLCILFFSKIDDKRIKHYFIKLFIYKNYFILTSF